MVASISGTVTELKQFVPRQRYCIQLCLVWVGYILLVKNENFRIGMFLTRSLSVHALERTILIFRRSSTVFGSSTSVAFQHLSSPSSLRKDLSTNSLSSRCLSYLKSKNNNKADVEDDSVLGRRRSVVQWYPGHIAKAERQLSETLKAVDVVVEVRDARACKATSHPRVGEWCAGRPRIVVLTHVDAIPQAATRAWNRAYTLLGAERWDESPFNTQISNQAKQAQAIRTRFTTLSGTITTTQTNSPSTKSVSPVEQVLFVDAKQGQGIHALHRAIYKAGSHVQERRDRRGLKERPLRVGIIGFPNVGKV